MQPKFISQQVDPETARYVRMLREGEELAQLRITRDRAIDRAIAAHTIRRRRLLLGWVIGSLCAVTAVYCWEVWYTFWAGVGASAMIGCGVSGLVTCYLWASEVEP